MFNPAAIVGVDIEHRTGWRAPTGGASQSVDRELTGQDKELDHAFRSAIQPKNPAPIDVYAEHLRSNYQPGVEHRDTLTSMATQAIPRDVYSRVITHVLRLIPDDIRAYGISYR